MARRSRSARPYPAPGRLEPVPGVPLLEAHDPATAPVVDLEALGELGRGMAAAFGVSPDEVRVAACLPTQDGGRARVVVPAAKPGRGGRRANQKGRPRKLRDAVTRSFTLERGDLARLEALAAARGVSLAELGRTAFAFGLAQLEGNGRPG